MSWIERLEKIISEKGPSTEVPKVPKGFLDTLDTSHPRPFQNNNSESARRHAYRFRLNNGDGGTYLTDEQDLDGARANLVKRYGDRLALVAEA